MDRKEYRENKPINDIKVSMGSRVRNVIRYCNSILKEKNLRVLNFSAVGGAIGKLVSTVEVLRIVNPGFYQVNKIGSVSYQSVNEQGQVLNNRLYPKLEVTLTLDEPTEKSEGFQAPLSEDERLRLFDLHSKRLSARTESRGRGRGRPGRGVRGGRGGPRGGFRGRGRGGNRGGFRGRGANRGGPRGRGGNRGGPRGGPRGVFRGNRGANRGRGGFNAPRGRNVPRVNRGRGGQA